MKQNLPETAADFQIFSTLSVLRMLHRDPVIKNLRRAQQHPQQEKYLARAREALLEQAEELGLSGNLWQGYFFHLLCEGNNLAGQWWKHGEMWGAGSCLP